MSDTEFEQGSSGASQTYPKQCSALRKNEYVMLKGHACKIVEMSTSKTGKHGHAKVHLVGLDIFDSKKYEDICPSTHNMDVPNVVRKEYSCSDIDEEGYAVLMDDKCNTREDLKCPDAIKQQAKKLIDEDDDCVVSVLTAIGREEIMSVKKSSKN